MPANLTQFIDAWAALPVLVVGDVMLDSYLHGTADRLCQEAPVPVVALNQRQDFPGGAANTATNVASLGAEPMLLSVIGTDSEGDRLQCSLEPHRVGLTSLIRSPQRTTLAKQRVLAASQLLVRLDQGSTGAIDPTTEQALIDRLKAVFPTCAAAIVSDYGYGILTPTVIQTLAELQATSAKPLVVDSKQLSAYRQLGVTAVKPNYQEAIGLLGLAKQTSGRTEQLMPYGDRLLQLTGARLVAVTLDAEGAILFERGQPPFRMAADPVPAQQTSGAGDTFISALTLSLAAGAASPTAASLAAAATAIVVQQVGTTPCNAIALRQSLLQPSEALSNCCPP